MATTTAPGLDLARPPANSDGVHRPPGLAGRRRRGPAPSRPRTGDTWATARWVRSEPLSPLGKPR